MVKIFAGILKLILFAALVILGIVFVSDDFMAQVDQKVGWIGNSAREEIVKRSPEVSQEISRKLKETKGELGLMYESFKKDYYPMVGNWFASLITSQK